MKQGWIRLHRSMLDNCLWTEKRIFSRAEAWIDILMHANFESGSVIINGIKVDLQPGDFATTVVYLSERWGWSRKKVKGFFDVLERDGMLSTKCTSKYTVLSIVKWAFYQQDEQEKSIKRTSKEQEKSIKRTQTKNVKNDKNVNNNNNIYTPYSPPKAGDGSEQNDGFDAFWTAYPRKHAKDKARKSWEKLKPDGELLQVILHALDEQMNSEQWSKEGGKYIPYPATWLNGKRWEDEAVIAQKTTKNCTYPARGVAQKFKPEGRDLAFLEK